MAKLKDHDGREIHKKAVGDRVMYWIDEKYYVVVPKHTPLREVLLLLEKFDG